ncbi:hypothetical protein [Streptomyces sp. NPDC054887]
MAEETDDPAEAGAPQVVPQPRQEGKATAAPAGARKRTARSKASAKGAAAPKKKATVTKAPAKKADTAVAKTPAKNVESPLHEVVLRILLTQPGHPHLAREVHTELSEKYGRSTSVQVVRNSLESVKKGTVDKENKQNSVMYTAPAPADTDASTAPEPAAEKAKEKVAAGA